MSPSCNSKSHRPYSSARDPTSRGTHSRYTDVLQVPQAYSCFPSICPRRTRIPLSFLFMDRSTLVFDTFDVDLVVKVLANTAFSPFFTGMIPVFYYFHVGTLKNDTVFGSFCYFLLVSSFCASAVSPIRAWFAYLTIGRQGSSSGVRERIETAKTFYLEAHPWIGVNRSLSSPVVRRLSVYCDIAPRRNDVV